MDATIELSLFLPNTIEGGHALERYNSLPSSRAQCFCSMNDTAFKVRGNTMSDERWCFSDLGQLDALTNISSILIASLLCTC